MTFLSRRGALVGLAASALSACAPRTATRRSAVTQAPVAPVPVPPSPALGCDAVIDLSHHTTVYDFSAAHRHSGILGVIHKATEGVGWVDPAYAGRQDQALAAGLLWGAYHFGTCQYSGAEQAEAFLSVVRPGPDTLMALDVELNERNPANSMDLGRAESFVQTIWTRTGRLPLVYIQPAWARGQTIGRTGRSLGGEITPDSILAACDLWLADYRSTPELPAAWNRRGWRLWQYAGDLPGRAASGPYQSLSRMVAGIDRCDRNLFSSGADALHRFWRAAPA